LHGSGLIALLLLTYLKYLRLLVGLGRSSYKLNSPFSEQVDPECTMAEYKALLNCIEDINDVLGSSDPESMAGTLLRMGLINAGDSQKLSMDSVISVVATITEEYGKYLDS